jgi:hypothetical protein
MTIIAALEGSETQPFFPRMLHRFNRFLDDIIPFWILRCAHKHCDYTTIAIQDKQGISGRRQGEQTLKI